MRNRCIELCLLPDEPAGTSGEAVAAEVEAGGARPRLEGDLLACLAAEGVPGHLLPAAMVAAHCSVATYAAQAHEYVLA